MYAKWWLAGYGVGWTPIKDPGSGATLSGRRFSAEMDVGNGPYTIYFGNSIYEVRVAGLRVCSI